MVKNRDKTLIDSIFDFINPEGAEYCENENNEDEEDCEDEDES